MSRGDLSQCVLFDWGDTVMQDFPEFDGPMHAWPRVEPVSGIRVAIEALWPAAIIALATNAADSDSAAIRTALERCDLSRCFDFVFCCRELGHKKPQPGFFHAIMTRLGLDTGSLFMVGDSFSQDVQAANTVGIPAVWYNARSEDLRAGPLHRTVSDLVDVPRALEALGFRHETSAG